MRSELIFDAKSQVSNRFLLAKLLAEATRVFHRPGSRIQDTTNDVLVRFSRSNPIADVRSSLAPSPPSRHNRPGLKTAYTSRRSAFSRKVTPPNPSSGASRVLGI